MLHTLWIGRCRRGSRRGLPSLSLAPARVDRVDRIGVATQVTPSQLPPDRVDQIGTTQQPTPSTPTVIVQTAGTSRFRPDPITTPAGRAPQHEPARLVAAVTRHRPCAFCLHPG
jgi:hypothetical protein